MGKRLQRVTRICFLSTTVAVLPAAQASDVLAIKRLSLEMANEIAIGAVRACRELGYQVSAVVVDRSGNPQSVMRDVHASRFTIQIAEEKANAVILAGVSSAVFRTNREDIREEMNHVRGVLVLAGGLPIQAAGALLGAVGVSGAPGGDKDEACARQAVEAVQERLDFVE